jgi:hypothetical protein
MLRRLSGLLLDYQYAVVKMQGVGGAREIIRGQLRLVLAVEGIKAIDQRLDRLDERVRLSQQVT